MMFKFVLPPEHNTDIVESYRKKIEECINDCMKKRYEMVEVLSLAIIAKTGFRPDQLELCEQRVSDTETKWFFRILGSEQEKADPCHVLSVPS